MELKERKNAVLIRLILSQKKKSRYSRIQIHAGSFNLKSFFQYHEANCPGRLIIELYMTASRGEMSREHMSDSGIATAASSTMSLSHQHIADEEWDTSVSKISHLPCNTI